MVGLKEGGKGASRQGDKFKRRDTRRPARYCSEELKKSRRVQLQGRRKALDQKNWFQRNVTGSTQHLKFKKHAESPPKGSGKRGSLVSEGSMATIPAEK